MMKIRFRLVLFIFVLLGWGCASVPDMVSKKRVEGEKYSADEVRHITVDQPFLLSGDYFRERTQKPVKLDELFSKSGKKQEIGESKTVIPDVTPETQSQILHQDASFLARSLPVKVGFILDHEKMSRETAEQLLRSIPDVAKAFPAVLADQDLISEALAITDCLRNRDLLCVSGVLSLYPGIQMLALVELFEVPEEMPGAARVKIVIVDTGLPFRYPLIEIAAPVKSETEINAFIVGVLHKVFDSLLKKSDIMPWFCRSFSNAKEHWYISAGKISGLKIGETLKVVSGGKIVRAPGGLPAGWIPGKQRGILNVDLFFGKDFASCSVAEGEGPKPEDLILVH